MSQKFNGKYETIGNSVKSVEKVENITPIVKEPEIKEAEVKEIKKFKTEVSFVRENDAVFYLKGWITSVDFENPEVQSKLIKKGNIIEVEYIGDLEKDTDGCFNLVFLPLKN